MNTYLCRFIGIVIIQCAILAGYLLLRKHYDRAIIFLKLDTSSILSKSIPCKNKEFKFEIEQHGDFWLFKNFIRAEHGEVNCYESVTYTTHGDLTYLSNLIPLAERWKAPVSVALETPGTDFRKTLESIFYYRKCQPSKDIIRLYVTFHFFFDNKHIPKDIEVEVEILEKLYACPKTPPDRNSSNLYRKRNKLYYNINVGRNLAKKCALTYFVFPSDIELYPNPGLVPQFLDMIAKNLSLIQNVRNVFFLPVFEMDQNQKIPNDKAELELLFHDNKARFFHEKICIICHNAPESYKWINNIEEKEMRIYASVKRKREYYHWEPFFIATQDDPIIFDERLSWEGKFNKMTMAYILCVLDYNFLGLSNAFLVHSPGKKSRRDANQYRDRKNTNRLVKKFIYPEITKIYGNRSGCRLFI